MILFVQGYIEELHDLHDEFSDKEIIKKKRKKRKLTERIWLFWNLFFFLSVRLTLPVPTTDLVSSSVLFIYLRLTCQPKSTCYTTSIRENDHF